MANKRQQYTQEFKTDSVKYRLNHPEVTLEECAASLGLKRGTLSRWISEYRQSSKDEKEAFRGSGNYSSEAEKEIVRLRRELKNANDVIEILKKTLKILS